MEKNKILIVDDDSNIAELISLYLTKECFECDIAENGNDALTKAKSFNPDLILLDIMLPGLDGYDVCREIRKYSSIPIIMMSAKGEVFDKVLGLELGADDYIIKPFDTKEMVARVKAVLRRTASKTSNQQAVKSNQENQAYTAEGQKAANSSEIVKYPDLTISITNYSVIYRGKQISMSPKELELLYFLAVHPNQVFTREQLLDQIWGYEFIGETRTVDVHIKRLREKIHDNENWNLSTVWGIGYKFEVKSK